MTTKDDALKSVIESKEVWIDSRGLAEGKAPALDVALSSIPWIGLLSDERVSLPSDEMDFESPDAKDLPSNERDFEVEVTVSVVEESRWSLKMKTQGSATDSWNPYIYNSFFSMSFQLADAYFKP